MKNFLKSILFLFIFTALCVGALLGVLRPESAPVTAVGAFQISPSQNGLTLSQGFRGEFYDISPFNDGLILKNGKRQNLITAAQLAKHAYTTSYPESDLATLRATILNYFGLDSAANTFITDKNISYTTSVEGDKAIITRHITLPKTMPLQKTYITLSFNTGDFIYDKNGNLYTYVGNENMTTFQSAYHISLVRKLDEVFITLPGKSIFIYSPKIAGVIKITATKNQTIKIDRNAKLIMLEESIQSQKLTQETQMHITVFNTPEGAK